MKKIIQNVLAWAILIAFFFWLMCINHISINQIGIAYNSIDGSVTVQDAPGFYITSPTTFVAKISTLPRRVNIPTNAVVINTKYVRFNKDGVEEYVKLQGFDWLLSDSGMDNILMGYAFSGNEYPFLEVLQGGGPESLPTIPQDWKRTSGSKTEEDKK